jgi:enoyl-CoA hydratase
MYFGVRRAVDLVNRDSDLAALIITGTGDVFVPGGELRGREPDRWLDFPDLLGIDCTPFEAIFRGIADTGYAAYLPAQIGIARARDMLLTGRVVTADEAESWGIFTRVVPDDEVLAKAEEIAIQICRTAPQARLQIKRIINDNYHRVDRMTFDALLYSDEMAEGTRAFAEKREAGLGAGGVPYRWPALTRPVTRRAARTPTRAPRAVSQAGAGRCPRCPRCPRRRQAPRPETR